MTILRNDREISDRSTLRIRSRVTMVFFMGLAAWITFRSIQSPQFNFVALALLLCASIVAFNLFQRWSLGARDRWRVTDALNTLSDEYVLLKDLTLPDRMGIIDHFLIGPNGCFVIEAKNYSGDVRCDGDDWFVDGRSIKSLSRHAKRNALAVKRDLAQTCFKNDHKVPAVVALLVFGNHKANLRISRPTVPVIRGDELANFIRKYQPDSDHHDLGLELADAIIRHLRTLQIPAAPPAERPRMSSAPSHRAL